jgi:hypothetical protein
MGLEVKSSPTFKEFVMDENNVDEKASQRNDPVTKVCSLAAHKWKIHNRKGKEEIKIQQEAVIEYGQGMLVGRRQYPSNRDFRKWVIDWKYDDEYPFNNPRERSDAMRIAEIVFRTHTEDCFANCEHVVPSNMMKWARKTGLAPVKRRDPELVRKARAQIRIAVENGKPVGRNKIAEDLGAHNSTVDVAIGLERGRLEGIAEGQALALNEQGKFTKAQAKHVEALIKKHRRDLDAQFAAAVEAEVSKQVKTRKAALEKAREAVAKQLNDAFKDQQYWKALINNHKPILTPEEFRAIVMALHPDNSASEETRARALQRVNEKKLQLTGKP